MKRDRQPRKRKALALANKIMSHHMFDTLIESELGKDVSLDYRQLLNSSEIIEVTFYRPWWRWSRANAYEQDGVIYLNERKFWRRSIEDWAFTIIHEVAHVLGYSHNGNRRTRENLNSVPYKADEIAEHVWKHFIRS